MKYSVSWIEDKFVCSWSSRSLIKTFYEVYGVKEFIIKCNKYSIRGSHFIYSDKYDDGFDHMVSCFLTQKQKIKLYRKLCKNAK